MGAVRTASWAAVGFTQQLGTADRWQWSGYAGHGRSSTPDGGRPWDRPVILVVDQLITHRLDAHWQVGAGASFRSQQRYTEMEPFTRLLPTRAEGRLHARIGRAWSICAWKMQITFKQELRRFCTPQLEPWQEDLEWRSRFKVQAERALGRSGMRKVVFAVEELFAMDHERGVPEAWSRLGYRESRLSTYLVQRLYGDRFDLAVGGMADLVRHADPAVGWCFVSSLVWRDPFHASAN